STVSPNAANYWVDVLFVPDSLYTHTFNLTRVTDSAGTTKSGTLQTLSVTSTDCIQSRSAATSAMDNSTQTLSSTSTHLIAQPEFKNVYSLGQNYPNPFTNQTNIQYSVPAPVRVNISLFDVNGKLVKVLVNEFKDPGIYKVNLNSGLLSGGLYFYKMQTRDFLAVKKMIVQ
ncbi:MAG: T9SS type A sorting domain-containing protein, partial [Chitinophagaceae bacterium]